MLTHSALLVGLLAYTSLAEPIRRDYGRARSHYRHKSFSPYSFSYGPHPFPPKYTESVGDPSSTNPALLTASIPSLDPSSASAAPSTSFFTGSNFPSGSSVITSKVSEKPSNSTFTDPTLGSVPSTSCTEEGPSAPYGNVTQTVLSHYYPSASSGTGHYPTFTPSKSHSLGIVDPSASAKPPHYSISGTRPYPYPNVTGVYDPTGSSGGPSKYPTWGTKSYPYPNATSSYDPTGSSGKPTYYPTLGTKSYPYPNVTSIYDPTGTSRKPSYYSASGTGRYSYPNATSVYGSTGPSVKPSYSPTSGTKSYAYHNASSIYDPTGSSGKHLSTGYYATNRTSYSATAGDLTATSRTLSHPTASSGSSVLSANGTSTGDPSSGFTTKSSRTGTSASADPTSIDPRITPSFSVTVIVPVLSTSATHTVPGDPSPTKLPPKPTTSSAGGYGFHYGYDFSTVRYERE